MQNLRLNIFLCRPEIFNYTTDINAWLLVCRTDGSSLYVFCTFALLYSGTKNKYLLGSVMKVLETLKMLKS